MGAPSNTLTHLSYLRMSSAQLKTWHRVGGVQQMDEWRVEGQEKEGERERERGREAQKKGCMYYQTLQFECPPVASTEPL